MEGQRGTKELLMTPGGEMYLKSVLHQWWCLGSREGAVSVPVVVREQRGRVKNC